MLDFIYVTWPGGLVLLLSLALALCVRMSRTVRALSWTPLVALLLLLLGLWFSRYDGQPMRGDHFDATFLYWSFNLIQRVGAGLAVLFLGPLIARAAVSQYSEAQVLRAGQLASVPLSAGLIGSSALYLSLSFTYDFGSNAGEVHWAASAALTIGASLSLLITLFFVTQLFSRRPPGSPEAF